MYIRIFMSKDMILLTFSPPVAEPQHEFIEAYQKIFHKLLGKKILPQNLMKKMVI